MRDTAWHPACFFQHRRRRMIRPKLFLRQHLKEQVHYGLASQEAQVDLLALPAILHSRVRRQLLRPIDRIQGIVHPPEVGVGLEVVAVLEAQHRVINT